MSAKEVSNVPSKATVEAILFALKDSFALGEEKRVETPISLEVSFPSLWKVSYHESKKLATVKVTWRSKEGEKPSVDVSFTRNEYGESWFSVNIHITCDVGLYPLGTVNHIILTVQHVICCEQIAETKV